jgi:hypothetical protein
VSLPPLDPHDVGFWDFSAPSGHFDNLGTGANVALVPNNISNGGLQRIQASPIGSCVYTGLDYGATIQSNATNQIRPVRDLSLLAFVKPALMQQPQNPGTGPIWGMVAHNNAQTKPFPWLLYSTNDANTNASTWGAPWWATIKTVGNAAALIEMRDGYGVANQNQIVWNQWNLIALTYDGAHLRAYQNGSRCSFRYGPGWTQEYPVTGDIDYGSGASHIVAGSSADVASWRFQGWQGFLQVRDVAMTDDEMLTYWRTLMGYVGSSTPSTTERARFMVASGSAVLGAG